MHPVMKGGLTRAAQEVVAAVELARRAGVSRRAALGEGRAREGGHDEDESGKLGKHFV